MRIWYVRALLRGVAVPPDYGTISPRALAWVWRHYGWWE